MRTFIACSTVAVLSLGAPAFAQTNNPAGMSPDTPRVETGQPAADAGGDSPPIFVAR
jgi:hypothetical protein